MTTLTNKEIYFLLLFMFVLLADTFCECRRLESVAMANSVTYLGSYAFRGCLSLTSVQLSNSLTIILGNTFAGCTNLSSISLPNSVKFGHQLWGVFKQRPDVIRGPRFGHVYSFLHLLWCKCARARLHHRHLFATTTKTTSL
jgi:hypothetical protein